MSSSLSVDALQTETGNIPASGSISVNFVTDYKMSQSPSNGYYGGSVIYPVNQNTEYSIRLRNYPSSVYYTQFIHFFRSYPSLDSVPFGSSVHFVHDSSDPNNYIIANFTAPPTASYAVVSFRFNDEVLNIRSWLEAVTVGNTLGLYTPLTNRTVFNLNESFDLTFSFTFLASGGVGQYKFSADFIEDDGTTESLYSDVGAGDYSFLLPAVGKNDILRITVVDDAGNSSVKNFNVDLIQHIRTQLPIPEIDVDELPDTSMPLDSGVADIIVNSFNALPSQLVVLLVPCLLLSLIGWWLHR